jgi:hypothetical protein
MKLYLCLFVNLSNMLIRQTNLLQKKLELVYIWVQVRTHLEERIDSDNFRILKHIPDAWSKIDPHFFKPPDEEPLDDDVGESISIPEPVIPTQNPSSLQYLDRLFSTQSISANNLLILFNSLKLTSILTRLMLRR